MIKLRFPTIAWGLLAAQFLMVFPADGQVERLELGRRLQRFELAWEQANEDQQAASAQPMQAAVNSFFSLQLKNAAERLDTAWLLVKDHPTADWQRLLVPFYLELERPVRDLSSLSMLATLKNLYPLKAELPEDYQIRLRIINQQGEEVQVLDSTIQLLRQGVQLSLESLAEGDYFLQVEIVDGLDAFGLIPVGFSLLRDFRKRLEQLQAAAGDRELAWSDSTRASVRSYADLLASLLEGDVQEIDYPAARMLRFAESLIEHPQRLAETVVAASQQHDLWLTLRHNRRQVPIRLRSPQPGTGSNPVPANADSSANVDGDRETGLTDQPLPVLILLHGAGGSENMFFQTYGAGRAVELGVQRGWLVVATRQGGIGGMGGLGFDVPQILDSLAEFFPIDRSRVFLMGHSMGAGQLIRQVSLHPEVPAAVAAIGGGNAIRNNPAVGEIPWFVAAGELDFGLRGAQALKSSLDNIGAAKLTYKVYPKVEHMVIVQACLDDAFEFFDQNARR
jgi:predicted esterase